MRSWCWMLFFKKKKKKPKNLGARDAFKKKKKRLHETGWRVIKITVKITLAAIFFIALMTLATKHSIAVMCFKKCYILCKISLLQRGNGECNCAQSSPCVCELDLDMNGKRIDNWKTLWVQVQVTEISWKQASLGGGSQFTQLSLPACVTPPPPPPRCSYK